MATTGIWKIGKRLDNVLVYTTNIEKTKNSEYTKEPYCNLHNVLHLITGDIIENCIDMDAIVNAQNKYMQMGFITPNIKCRKCHMCHYDHLQIFKII